jgi:hypothetical protein
MAKPGVEVPSKNTLYCVKVQRWKNGLLKKTVSKEFFKTLREAELVYNGHDEEGMKVQLSVYRDGNERTIKVKVN